jgi:death on curing protein
VTVFPTVQEVLMAHARLIELFGGAHGVRDLAALKSALGRVRSGYYVDVIEQAAALLESLSQNHPFLDGNKRTAITVTAAFLSTNGYDIEFDDLEAYEFLMALYETNDFRFSRLLPWLRQHARPTNPRVKEQ